MIELNQLLKSSFLTSGDFDGERINTNKRQQFLQIFSIIILIIEAIKVPIVLTHLDLKYYLPVLYLTDDEMSQRLFTMCTFFVHIGFAVNHYNFYTYNENPEKIEFLKYFLYRIDDDLKDKLEREYLIGDRRIEEYTISYGNFRRMLSLESKINLVRFMQDFAGYSIGFILQCLIFRSIYLSYLDYTNDEISGKIFLFCSIPFAMTLDLAFYIGYKTMIATYILFIVNCKTLTIKLDDLRIKFEILAFRFKWGEIKSIKTLDYEIRKLVYTLDSILDFKKSTQDLADDSIAAFYLCVLLIALFFPFMMLFENNDLFYQIVLIVMYIVIMCSVCVTIAYSNTTVFKGFERLKVARTTLLFCIGYSEKKYAVLKRLFEFYPFDNNNEINFNCYGLFNYTYSFLLEWVLNSITMVFLLYGIKYNLSLTPT